MEKFFKKVFSFKYSILVGAGLCFCWFLMHIPALMYGTNDVPLHRAYIGDEGSPVNGALHILQNKSLLAVHNLETLYYGPLFAVIAVPAVTGDFVEKYVVNGIRSAEGYKNYIIYDWGGIVWKTRLLALLAGFLGLLALYKLLMTKIVNPKQQRLLAIIGVSMLALNFYYFEYASFFRHWIFVLAALLWQIYFLVRLRENPEKKLIYYIIHVLLAGFAFGVSYLSVFSQVIFIPLLYTWIKNKDYKEIKKFLLYVLGLGTIYILIAVWHPYALVRIFGIVGNNILGGGVNEHVITEAPAGFSFWYYSQIILFNHSALTGALILMVSKLRTVRFENKNLLWAVALVGIVFYLVLGLFSLHESRYALPMIVMLVVFSSLVFVYVSEYLSPIRRTAVYVLLGSYFLFHVVTIGIWNGILLEDHPERAAITEAVEYQRRNPDSKQLILGNSGMLGWPHSKEATEAYITNFKLAELNLFQAYLTTAPPDNFEQLKLYYEQTETDLRVGEYDRVILKMNTMPQVDYHEVNLVRYWTDRHVWQDQFFVLKEETLE